MFVPLLLPLLLLNSIQGAYSLSTPSCISYNPAAKSIIVNCTSANLSYLNNQINDPSILYKQEEQQSPFSSPSSSNNIWILNSNLTIAQGATFYINSTDTAWLKISSKDTISYSNGNGNAVYGIQVFGSLKIDSAAGAIFRIVPVNDTSYPDARVNAKANTNTLSSPSATTKGTGAQTHTVSIVGVRGDKSYIPNPIDIKVGDTVTWKNTDQISHTVTSGNGPTDPTAGKSFDSHVLLSNGGIFSHQFNEPGTYNYYCIFHPTMIGRVDVVATTTTTNQLPRQQQQEQQPGSQTTGIPGVIP